MRRSSRMTTVVGAPQPAGVYQAQGHMVKLPKQGLEKDRTRSVAVTGLGLARPRRKRHKARIRRPRLVGAPREIDLRSTRPIADQPCALRRRQWSEARQSMPRGMQDARAPDLPAAQRSRGQGLTLASLRRM